MTRKLRVMIADDEEAVLDDTQQAIDRILGSGNYEVISCASGEEAISTLKQFAHENKFFDLVFADSAFEDEGDHVGQVILVNAWELCRTTQLFLVSQYFGTRPAILAKGQNISQSYPGIDVTLVSKAGLEDPYDPTFKDQFIEALHKWNKIFVKRLPLQSIYRIRQACQQYPDDFDAIVQVFLQWPIVDHNGEKWHIGDLFCAVRPESCSCIFHYTRARNNE